MIVIKDECAGGESMTLFEVVAAGGVVWSFALVLVLTSLGPVRRHRCVFTMSEQEHVPQDAPVAIGNTSALVDGPRLAAGGAPT